MKNKFLIFIMVIFCAISINYGANLIYAETNSVTNITSSLYLSSIPEVPQNNVYHAPFDNINRPYRTYTVKTTITTQPIAYESLQVQEQQSIIADMKWSINTNQISFTDGQYSSDLCDVSLSGKDMSITPKHAGTFIITCTLRDHTTTINLMCDYTTPTMVTITPNNEINQLYEEYTPITFTAQFNYQEFLDPNKIYNYTWSINGEKQTEKTNTFTLIKDMVKIGTMRISVSVDEDSTLASPPVDVVITTNLEYEIQLIHTENLVQTLGENNSPINFEAELPILENYTVNWFIKNPKSYIFVEQKTNEKSYTFNPLANQVGEYKIFAQIILKETTLISPILEIKLNAKTVTTDQQFTIETIEYDNVYTNIQGYQCSINTQGYYEEDQIVWYANGKAFATGSKVIFEPPIAGEYILQVKALTGNSDKIIAPTKIINATQIQNLNVWIYVSIAFVILCAICVCSILISNKMREKIW